MDLGRKAEDETPKLTKLERLEALAARLTADRAALDVKIPELAAREFELRREGVRKDPDRRSDWQGARGEATRLALERKKLEDSIPALDAELAAVAIELQTLRDEEAQAVFDGALAGIKEIDAVEAEALDDLKKAHAVWTESLGVLREVYAAKRAYPGNFTLDSQGRVNELRAAAERTIPIGPADFYDSRPVWDYTAEDVFKKLSQTAAIEAVPPADIWYHLPENASDADVVANFTAINRARIEGISTQPIPVLPEHLGGPKPDPRVLPEPKVVVEPEQEVVSVASEPAVEPYDSDTGRRQWRRSGREG